jgi:hypothetical protein
MDTGLCKYKYILGKPNEGVHALRIGPFAFIDILLTVIVSLVISMIFEYNFFAVLICLFILAEALHLMFCVDTAFIKIFFPNIANTTSQSD